MSKKGENITKRKDGRYEARYVKERNEKGKITKYGFVYAKNYLEVKRKREKILREKRLEIASSYNEENLLVKDSIFTWLDSKVSIKDSSYTNYYSIIHSKIIPFLGNVTLKKIDQSMIIQFIEHLQKSGLGNKRIQDILLVLKQFLNYHNLLIKFETPKVIPKKIDVIRESEIQMIEKYTLESSHIKEFCISLVLFTGIRIGELCAMQWRDVDFESKVIHISKTLIRVKNKNVIGYPKTKVLVDVPKTKNSIRDVPINDVILLRLKKFQQKENFYVLTESENFMTTRDYYMFYQRFIQAIGIRKYRFHILRHTFATHALKCGMDVKTLSEILGHSSVKTTLDLYVHISNHEKLLQINKLTF